jgi:hypothetical protein
MEIPAHGFQPAQPRAEIDQPPGHQMYDIPFPLDLPEHAKQV